MALFVLWCLVLLAAALPDLCPRALSLSSHPPDVWLAVVVYLALRARGYRAVGWAIVLGLVRDALSLDPLGTHAFVLGTVAFVFSEGRRHRGPVKGVVGLVAVFAAGLLAGWLYLLRLLPMGSSGVEFADVLRVVPTAFFTTLFALGLYPLLDHYHLLDDLGGRRRGLPA